MDEKRAEGKAEDIDPAEYRIARRSRTPEKSVVPDDPPMDIRKFLDWARGQVSLPVLVVPAQAEALCSLHRGQILPRSEWARIISDELTRRTE